MLAVAYAASRASHARQIKGDDPDKEGYHGLPGWRLGVRLTTPPLKKMLLGNLKKKKIGGQGFPRNSREPPLQLNLMFENS